MPNRNVAYTEYAVEINDNTGFVRQLDVFNSYEDAETFIKHCNESLNDDEYFNIVFIDYNTDGDEIAFGTVC